MAGTSDRDKPVISTFCYPRSGSTFLYTALEYLYEDYHFIPSRHTVWEVKDLVSKGEKLIVPFRNPVDSIGSWNVYRQEGYLGSTHFDWHNDTLEGDIKFYLRFYSEILPLKDNLIFFDFNKFTSDLSYIKSKMKKHLNMEPTKNPLIEFIKSQMKSGIRKLNLPRETKPIIETVKPLIEQHPLYSDTLSLYQKLQELEQEQG